MPVVSPAFFFAPRGKAKAILMKISSAATLLLRLAALITMAAGGAALGMPPPPPPAPPLAAIKPPANADCFACHADADAKREKNGKSVQVTSRKFDASVHGQAGVACVDCHADLARTSDFPHKTKLKPVNCASCHDQAGPAHPFHPEIARMAGSPGQTTVGCADCHGSHEITPVRIVVAFDAGLPDRLTRCTAGLELVSSQTNRSVGCESPGQSTI